MDRPNVTILKGDARDLDLPDDSVDLIVTSPPYFGLRSYQDGGEHYAEQIGAEATPTEFVDALIDCTREWMRVVKPSGSIWVNLGDKYAGQGSARPAEGSPGFSSDQNPTDSSLSAQSGQHPSQPSPNVENSSPQTRHSSTRASVGPQSDMKQGARNGNRRSRPAPVSGIPGKSLMGIPWRYAIRCIDELGLILRAEVIWSKPNGLPESVTDRVRRSHEVWFHFTLEPRYYSAVDEIREPNDPDNLRHSMRYNEAAKTYGKTNPDRGDKGAGLFFGNPLGKLPGSVWTIPTEPLHVPDHLGVDHFAAFPTEWPRRIIQGWSPRGVCVECGAGRRPVVERRSNAQAWSDLPLKPGDVGRSEALGKSNPDAHARSTGLSRPGWRKNMPEPGRITGEACDCPEPTAPTTPGVVLDPFGGTGTTALVASVLGRRGISNDMSSDYNRIAEWRTTDPKQRAKAARKPYTPAAEQVSGQLDLFDFGSAS